MINVHFKKVAKQPSLPETFGFRTGDRGTHTSRTIMLSELTALLASCPPRASRTDYDAAIVGANVLGKKTASTRRLTAQRLRELYALSPNVTLFRVLRKLWEAEPSAQPLLAMLCATARDPILRLTAEPILNADPEEVVPKQALINVVIEATGDRFNLSTVDKIARNALSSWTQSGHLSGRQAKRRKRPALTPSATCYALLLGYLDGARGTPLFHTLWTRILDHSVDSVVAMGHEAARKGWLNFKQQGSVVEIRFPQLLTPDEEAILRGSN